MAAPGPGFPINKQNARTEGGKGPGVCIQQGDIKGGEISLPCELRLGLWRPGINHTFLAGHTLCIVSPAGLQEPAGSRFFAPFTCWVGHTGDA